MLEAGMVVDNLQIISRLGEGGMGQVFKALDLALHREVALKLLHAELSYLEDNRLRFEREARILATLVHPNILKSYQFGRWQQFQYIVVEYLQGVSLRETLNKNSKLAPEVCIEMAKQICDGLSAAHQAGIVHRDIKPNNIMLVDEPDLQFMVKILDFGLASDLQTSQHLTQTGELIGSIYYISPEQCRGLKADHRSDIYALGCVLFESLEGSVPFDSDNPIALVHLHAHEPPPPLRTICKGLDKVILRCLAKDPDARYQSVLELKYDLELVEQGRGHEIGYSGWQLDSKPRRPRARITTVIIVLVVALSGFGLWSRYARQPTAKANLTAQKSANSLRLGQLLAADTEIKRRFPRAVDRAAALKTWLNSYGERDALATGTACFQLHVALLEIEKSKQDSIDTDRAATTPPSVEKELTAVARRGIASFEKVTARYQPVNGVVNGAVLLGFQQECILCASLGDYDRARDCIFRPYKLWYALLPTESKFSLLMTMIQTAAQSRQIELERLTYKELFTLDLNTEERQQTLLGYARYLYYQRQNNASIRVLDEVTPLLVIPSQQCVEAARLYMLQNAHRKAYDLAIKVLPYSKTINQQMGYQDVLYETLAFSAKGLGKHAEAQEYFQRWEPFHSEIGKWCLLGELICNAQKGHLPIDQEALIKKQELRSTSKVIIAKGLMKAAQLLAERGMSAQSVNLAHRSLKSADQVPDSEYANVAHIPLLASQILPIDAKQAEDLCLHALRKLDHSSSRTSASAPVAYMRCYYYLATALYSQNRFAEAERNATLGALQGRKTKEYRLELAVLLSFLSQCKEKIGKMAEAKQCLLEALAIARSVESDSTYYHTVLHKYEAFCRSHPN